MENVAVSSENVNIFSFLSFMHKMLPNRPYWEKGDNGFYYLKRPCSQDKLKLIPNSFYFNPSIFDRNQKGCVRNANILWAKEILKYRNLSDSEMKEILLLCQNKLMMIMAQNSKGNTAWFEGNAKGTERYNKVQTGKILDFVKAHQNGDFDSFFLTLTCDIKKYENRADAWENYLAREFYPVMENLRKHFGVEYVATLESTAKGYPHIHIVAFCPKGQFKELKLLPNKKKIRNGKLFNMVHKSVTSPVFCLEVAKGDGLKWYLTKYLTKGIEDTIFKLQKKEGEFTKTERKNVMEFIYLKLFNRRKVLMTRKGCKGTKKEEEKVIKEQLAKVEKMQSEEKTSTELRSDLTSLCTNSPDFNLKSVYSMSFNNFIECFNEKPSRNNDVSEEKEHIFEEKGRLIWDNCNFIYDFMQFVRNPKKSLLNLRFYWNVEEDIYSDLIDGYDLDNDEDFLRMVIYTFDYFCTEILCNGEPYRSVLNQTCGLTGHRKTRTMKDYKVFARSTDDPKENFYSEKEWEEMFESRKEKEKKDITKNYNFLYVHRLN